MLSASLASKIKLDATHSVGTAPPNGTPAELIADNPVLEGLHPWLAFLLNPWLQAIQQATPGSAHWLRETSTAMSACLRDWIELTPPIEEAIEAACAASDVLLACLTRSRWTNVEAQRQIACAAMGLLIDRLRRADPCEMRSGFAIGA